MRTNTLSHMGTLIVAFLALALLAPLGAAAQTIGVIDEERIGRESDAGKKEIDRIQALFDERLGQLRKMEAEVEQIQEQLRSRGFSIKQAERTKMERQIQDRIIEAQRFQKDSERELNSQMDDLRIELSKLSGPVIEELARERGVELIFVRGTPGLVYVAPALDLTAEVIERLNKSTGAGGK